MNDLKALHQRIERLRRWNRLAATGLFVACMMFCSAASSAFTQPPEILDDMQLTKVAILDESDRERIGLQVDVVDGVVRSPRILLQSVDGAQRVVFAGRPQNDLFSLLQLKSKGDKAFQSFFTHPDEYAIHWGVDRNGRLIVNRGGR